MSIAAAAKGAEKETSTGKRLTVQVTSLSELLGAHPDSLEKMYRAGKAADPAELGESPRGLLLSSAKGKNVFLLTRPLMKALGSGVLPWEGKTFDHGGNSGQNLVMGKRLTRFHAEVGPSELDGKPSLILSYANPAHGNPWPLRDLRDELRTVAHGVAIGPAFFMGSGSPNLLMWFGLEAR